MEEENGDETFMSRNTKAGVIERMCIKNFMCHSHLEVEFNKRINFISGFNGSGKSAILTALVVGMGGKANSTNRGSSLKDFIKKGKSKSIIEITIKNTGYLAYRQDVYGDYITIIRSLEKSGTSSYKIKSDKGEAISVKREELDKIIAALNIQVENPISILNQETARTFLTNSDPKDKYKVFIKATQLEKLFDFFVDTVKEKKNICSIVDSKKEAIKTAKSVVKDLENKKKKLEAVQDYRHKKRELQNELTWAIVIANEKNLDKSMHKFNEKKNLSDNIKKTLEKQAELEKKLQHNVQILSEELQGINDNLVTHESLIKKLKEEEQRKKTEYKNKLQECNNLKIKNDQAQEEVETYIREIDNLKKKSGPDHIVIQEQIKEEILKLEQKKVINENKISTHTEFCNQLGNNINKLRTDERKLRQDVNEKSKEIDRKQQQLDSYKREKNNTLTLFGSWVPRVTQRIEEALRRGQFEKKPRGPLGSYIKVKDQKWIPTIEFALSSHLKGYFVNSRHDNNILQNIFKEEIRGEKPPVIITGKFHEKVYDVSKNAVRADGYINLMNCLNVTDEVVLNCLIDQAEIESVLLIPTNSEACNMMSRKQNVPRNCKRAYTLDGDIYYPAPNYRTYAGNIMKPRYLQVNMSTIINALEEELNECVIQNNEIRSQLNHVTKELVNKVKELSLTQLSIRDLKIECSKIEKEISDKRDSIEIDPSSISELHVELEKTKKKVEELVTKSEIIDTECINLHSEMKEAVNRTEHERQKLSTIKREKVLAEEKIKEANSELQQFLIKINSIKKKYNETANCLLETESEVNQKKTSLEESRRKANTICDRVNTKRSVEEIKLDLSSCNAYMEGIESVSGSYEQILSIYNEKKSKYEKIINEMSSVETGIEILGYSLSSRSVMYKSVRSLVTIRLKHLFNSMLYGKKYKAKVEIDHENRTLNIVVEQSIGDSSTKSDARSLSGGERSFSTVCFIMALWDCVEPPFYFLDEFDVFMDNANRQMILDQLLSHAKSKKNNQFGFLTPLDIPVRNDPEISILKLEDPRHTRHTQ